MVYDRTTKRYTGSTRTQLDGGGILMGSDVFLCRNVDTDSNLFLCRNVDTDQSGSHLRYGGQQHPSRLKQAYIHFESLHIDLRFS